MCGIVGLIAPAGQPAPRAVLARMTAALAHRGPDGEGLWTEGPVGLGHRRLAILDLSPAGHQPMASADGRWVVSYNGEIYNFQELRLELEAAGRRFRSRCDTEVLCEGLAHWGHDGLLPRLNGMFAWAAYDRQDRNLHLARDRYGIKPLYYTSGSWGLIFASEIKACRAHPEWRADLDPAALAEYLCFQNLFTDRTLFAGVRLLPPGTTLAWSADGPRALTERRWWSFAFREPERRLSTEEAVEELDHRFRAAVDRQLISDVEVGSYLSGGLDSGAIASLAARQLPHLRSFTCGFDLHSASGLELGCDERQAAEHLSYLAGTEHYEVILKAGDMQRVLPGLVWDLEDLRVGQCYPNHYVAGLASRFVRVVLSGTGGDELFAGYPWRYCRAGPDGEDFAAFTARYLQRWQRLVPVEHLEAVLAPLGPQARVDHLEIFRSAFAGLPRGLSQPTDPLNLSLSFEARTFLHGLLVVEDRLSMAHGLETRVPFLDNDLVDFALDLGLEHKLALSLPGTPVDENQPGHKTASYYRRTRDGKRILRRMLERYAPPALTEAEKQGFSGPDGSWFKGESIEFVRRTIGNPQAVLYRHLDHRALWPLVEDHLAGRVNRRLLIWSLLSLELWMQKFLAA